MTGLLMRADDVLRRRGFAVRGSTSELTGLAGLIAAFGMLYGALMGSYGGWWGPPALQMLYAAIKVPLLLLVTFGLSLPSFFVLNSLAGLRSDFGQAVRALLATQAGLAVILASLAPFTLFWYASCELYPAAIFFNAVMFAVASFAAQVILRAHYQPLLAKNPNHRWMLRGWLVVYAFVGIQMGWVLRPFIGDPASPVQFFRSDSWGNAYVVVARLFWQVLFP
ncbi:MAG TPA: hypothetical protein VMF30_15945 [Pirellulales bacterium]|nr:hypothetical protein [Pirellulales bacterium]